MATQVGRKDAVAQLIPGTQLKGSQGRIWKVGDKIGQGQCCVAYSGTLMGEDIHSAVKVFNPQLNYSAACQREARLLDILHRGTGGSKFLVKKFDEFRHNQSEVLVCELLGDSLQILLAHHVDEKMSLWMIQKLLLDIFRGLEILHTRGFVHADIKPGNIHWCPKEYCAKLIDYGLTFHIQDKVKGAVQSTHYRAPESGNIVGACNVESQTTAGQTMEACEVKSAGAGAIHGIIDLDPAIMPRNSNSNIVVSGVKSDHCKDSHAEGQSGTSGTVKMRRNRGIVHHKPSASSMGVAGANTSYRNISEANNCESGQNQTNDKDSYPDHHHKLTEPDKFEHQPGLPSLNTSSNKNVSNRRGVVHHRPEQAASSSGVTDTKRYSLNQGASTCSRYGTYMHLKQYFPSAEMGFQSVGFEDILSQENNKSTTDSKMMANVDYSNLFVTPSNDYSALTELTRVARTVCNCVTCGRHLSCAIDIWSVGCVILKMFLGGQGLPFSGKPKCENCLGHSLQMACKVSVDAGRLIRVREEDRDVEQKSSVVGDLKNLVQRCLSCHSTERISVAAAISHPFFHHYLTPSYRDMLLLPSPVLCLLNMVDDGDLESEDEPSDIEDDIKEECEKYGEVKKCVLCKAGPEKSKVFVCFVRTRDCMAAWKCLNGKTFNSRTVITCYYPLDKFHLDILNKIT
ncbi:serine/threonine-protein kinase Kist-like [Lineus longissimus]|uniref:serine/threonine-protein kinase Kist-like n=1 Tax=Lineus longissimus TaxID=88925 RepID=UPI002B4D66C0